MDGEAACGTCSTSGCRGRWAFWTLFHVLERLWQAAHVFHREGSPAG